MAVKKVLEEEKKVVVEESIPELPPVAEQTVKKVEVKRAATVSGIVATGLN